MTDPPYAAPVYCVTEPRSPIPRKILFLAVLREDTLSGNPPFKAAFVGAPPQWGFARHGRGLRRVRGGSCAPNAMPPFAPPCGHFASLVRSFATLIARVPSETLRVSAAHLAPLESVSLPPPAVQFSVQSSSLNSLAPPSTRRYWSVCGRMRGAGSGGGLPVFRDARHEPRQTVR